jgi:hypothetical protein
MAETSVEERLECILCKYMCDHHGAGSELSGISKSLLAFAVERFADEFLPLSKSSRTNHTVQCFYEDYLTAKR